MTQEIVLHKDATPNRDLMTQEHSLLLNQILWSMLLALGRVNPETTSHIGNPEQIAAKFWSDFHANNLFAAGSVTNAEAVSGELVSSTPGEDAASKLIDTWASLYGPISWAKAVEIIAILTHITDAEKQRLLDMQPSEESRGDLPG